MELSRTSNGVRKVINGNTLAFEHGSNLSITFIDHKSEQMRTFQLSEPEITVLIDYLAKVIKGDLEGT